MIFQLLHRLVLTALVIATPILVQAAESGVPLTIGDGTHAAFRLAEASFDAPVRQFSTSHAQLDLYPFDGEWEGELRTTFSSGPCGMKYRLTMSVTQGAATGSAARGGERFTLYGKISADGKISWSVTSGRGSADGEGMVDGATARGEWEDDTGQCTGTFSIEKKS